MSGTGPPPDDAHSGVGAQLAALVGGTAGAVVSAAELAAIGTLGLPTSGAFLLVLAELALLERLQVGMVFTLADVQGHPLADDLTDVGVLYGHVLKVKGATRAAAYARDGSIMLFRTLGVRFLQRAAVKLAVPFLSVGVGGGMNYLMTRSLGRHSKRRFAQDLAASRSLRAIAVEEEALRRLLVALMALMATADGRLDRREKALLRKTLDELEADGASRASLLEAIERPDETVFAALEAVADDGAFREVVLELLALMAVADGRLDAGEVALLRRVSGVCGLPFDEAELRARHAEFLRDADARKAKKRRT
ncbi:MAG: TerB family tellurite resistance protein [Myxococcales bacterium]|nr:TerB family tellurite resistance protein [Myxococcales bacterium]